MVDMEMNAQTVALLVVVLILFVFALRRAAKVFGGKEDCCGGGGASPAAKKVKPVVVEDADESHYPYRLELVIGGMSCDHCRATVEHSVNAIPGTWARVDLDSRKAVVLGKRPIAQDAVEAAVEEAGYYVVHQPE